jgi:hypothetical protein
LECLRLLNEIIADFDDVGTLRVTQYWRGSSRPILGDSCAFKVVWYRNISLKLSFGLILEIWLTFMCFI